MTRSPLLPCGLLALLLAAGLGLVALAGRLDRGPVYSVAQVQAELAGDPAAWVGRAVLVRGFLDGCLHPVCDGHEPYLPPRLVDLDHLETVSPLQVEWTGPAPGMAFLRGLPVLGKLVPPPQLLRWEEVATYRIQLRAVPAAACPTRPCYVGLVLDATPGETGE